ncbi:MAG: hypothetical protein RL030_2083 [Pseudomonadota bacterium]|jgi:hypothetical protein
MNMKLSRKLGAAAMVAALLAPLGAQAESTTATGPGTLVTSARLDFQITIPRFLSLRVGPTGSGVFSLIDFNVLSVGSGAVAGVGGDAGAGAVNAAVVSNVGAVSLLATNGGALNDGGANTISWSQITTASTNPSLPAPVLANTTSAAVSIPVVAGVVNQSSIWTYTFANSAVVVPGTYGGVGVRNGRLTYTATSP